MRLHALVLALFALHARSATIPNKLEAQFEKKLADAVQEVLSKDQTPDNISSEQELIDQANNVKDVENNLRNRVEIADIPVKVIVEDVQPALKSENEKKENNNEVAPVDEESVDIKRVEIDLNNPGEPQRQEHDSQSAAPNEIQNMQTQLQSWLKTNQQIQLLQKNIKTVQDTFAAQLNKFNETLQSYLQPIQPQETHMEPIKNENIILKSGLNLQAPSVRAENETPSQGFGSQIWQQYQSMVQNMTQTMQQWVNQTQQSFTNNTSSGGGFGNWWQQANNFTCPGSNQQGNQGGNWFNFGNPLDNNNAKPQSDEGAGAPASRPPGIFQGIQNLFQGPPQGVQHDETPTERPNRPLFDAFQNVLNFVNPNRPPASTPVVKPDVAPETPAAGSNSVPNPKPEKEQDSKEPAKPEAPKPVVPAPVQLAQSGPIKQMIERNPIAQGIAGAVQRLQHAINPEKPRDVKEGEKGIHNPGNGNQSGDNNNDRGSGVVQGEPGVGEIKEVLKEPKEVVDEDKTPEVPDKTE